MANFLDQAKSQFTSLQGTVSDTLHSVKKEAESNASKIQGQVTDLFSKAPQVIDSTARDLEGKAEASASSTSETAKTEVNNVAAFFAGIFEKCCAPFNQKKD